LNLIKSLAVNVLNELIPLPAAIVLILVKTTVLREQRPGIPIGFRLKTVDKLLKFALKLVLNELRPIDGLYTEFMNCRARLIVQRVLSVPWPIVVLRVLNPTCVIFSTLAREVLKELVPCAELL
jgi:hypothetical protein